MMCGNTYQEDMQLLLQEFVCGIDVRGWGWVKVWCDGSCTNVTRPVKRDAEVEHSSDRCGDDGKLCGVV